MPQILQGFGMDCALVGRGTVPLGYQEEYVAKKDEGMSEFGWISPDGSEVFTSQFVFWYSNGMELPEDKFRQIYKVHRFSYRVYGEFAAAYTTKEADTSGKSIILNSEIMQTCWFVNDVALEAVGEFGY